MKKKPTTVAAIVPQDPREGLPSASNAWRRRMCQGSTRLCKDVPPEKTNDLADDGTNIHRALQTDDFSKLDDQQFDIATVSKEMIERAFHEWLMTVPEQYRDQITEYRETRFWIVHPQSGEKMESAQIDRGWICLPAGMAFIGDYKTGFMTAMPSPRNYQLRVQALAIWNTWPKEITKVRVAIVQYRLKRNFDACDYSPTDLKFSQQEFLLSDWMSKQPDAPLTAGEWCGYCPAKAYCTTAVTHALIPQMVPKLIPTVTVEERVELMAPGQLVFVQLRSTIGKKIFEAVAERLKALPLAELNAIGLDLAKPAKTTTVSNLKKAKRILSKHHLITAEEWQEVLAVQLTKLDNIVVPRIASREEVSQKIAKKKLRELLEPSITTSEKAPSLIPYDPQTKQITETAKES